MSKTGFYCSGLPAPEVEHFRSKSVIFFSADGHRADGHSTLPPRHLRRLDPGAQPWPPPFINPGSATGHYTSPVTDMIWREIRHLRNFVASRPTVWRERMREQLWRKRQENNARVYIILVRIWSISCYNHLNHRITSWHVPSYHLHLVCDI